MRATLWAGGDSLSLWRVTAGTFSQLGSNVLMSALPTDRLRIRKIDNGGGSVSVIGYLMRGEVEVATIGPFDVAGGPNGDYGGFTVYVNMGAAAILEIEDWIAQPLSAPVIPIAGADQVGIRSLEALSIFGTPRVGEAVPVGLGEWPQDTWRDLAQAEAVPVGLAEAAAISGLGVFGVDATAIRLAEAAAVLLLNPTFDQVDTVKIGIVEVASVEVVGILVLAADSVAVDLAEQNFVDARTELTAVDTVEIGLAEREIPFTLLAGPIGLILVLDIASTDAGPVEIEAIQAGPEEIIGEKG